MTAIYYLGPQGTFSSLVGARLSKHFRYPQVLTKSIPEVFVRTITQEGSLGLVPIENLSIGIIGITQENLQLKEVAIIAEMKMEIAFSLVRNTSGPIQRLYAFEVSFDQCSEFVYNRITFDKQVDTLSNIDSFQQFEEQIRKDNTPCAAIVPKLYSMQHDLRAKGYIVEDDIQNDPDNFTRFFIIRNATHKEEHDFSRAKTTVFIDTKGDRPSLLYDILGQFKKYDINLSSLHSTPSKKYRGNYGFFIDFQNKNPDSSQECLSNIAKLGPDLKILGTYDRLD